MAKHVEMKSKYRRLTLQALFAAKEEIWVRNKFHAVTGREPANVVMEVRNGSMVDALVVPPGNDPVCLTDQAVPKLLSECMDLYKLTKSGILEVLDPAYAQDYYNENQGRKEAVEEKIQGILNHKTPIDAKRPAVTKHTLGSTEVNPKVGDICLKAKHAALSEREALERLIEQEEVLSINDFDYLVSNGVFDNVKNWARDQANKKRVGE